MTTAREKEERKKYIVIGVFVLLLGFVGYRIYDGFFGGTTSVPPPPVVVVETGPGARGPTVVTPPGNAARGTARKVGTTSGLLDPTLHEEAMLVTEGLVYSGTGRNIFAAGAAQAPPAVKIPVPIQGPRQVIATGPPPPPPPPPTCPPTCPAIQLKFFGTSTSAEGVRTAFLLQGDNVFLASAGDVVERKYRVVSITANSIVVEDIPNVNKQTLPLMSN